MPFPEEGAVELRSAVFQLVDAADDGSNFSGYAAVFDAPTQFQLPDGTEVHEVIERGAFRKALTESRNVPLLWNHNPDWPLATTDAGTLKLHEDPKGLRVDASIGRDFMSDFVRERIRRREVQGMSYGFVVAPDGQKIFRENQVVHRSLRNFRRLLDVSPTWDPASKDTMAELRHLASLTVDLQQALTGDAPQLEGGGDQTDAHEGHSGGLVPARKWRSTSVDLL